MHADKFQPSLKRVMFVSQRQAEGMHLPRTTALISITDPARQSAKIGGGWHSILRVTFDDVDPVTFPGQDGQMRAISSQEVAVIAAFVAEHIQSCRRLVVHCRHGVSRSAAVAKAIAEVCDAPFPADYEEFNQFVYLVLRGPLMVALDQARLAQRQE